MDPVLNYIYDQNKKNREMMLFIHNLLMSFPELTSKISYKIPFYYRNCWICYQNPLNKGGLELGFPRGFELSNHHGLLEAKGRKMVKSITFYSIRDIPETVLPEILNEAIILDNTKPYSFRNR